MKPLEKNQGQLEHSSKPGVHIEVFTQNDLNRGLILYHSPREVGIYPKDYTFTFIGELFLLLFFFCCAKSCLTINLN